MATAQASEVNYQLESLGWKAFQDLCATILSDILGQTVQTFLPSHDGGRDGAFQGKWNAGEGSGCDGSFTVQCKFSSKTASLTISNVSNELLKARLLAQRGLADNYVLITNLGVSGAAEARVRDAFLKIDGVKFFTLFGRDWITRKIRETPRLRMLVPRVYGLGDLSQILDERAYLQSLALLSALGDDLSKFVVTQAYTNAAKALVDHGFVLLLGEPAAGKSTIAASLAIGALDLWGCSTIRIRGADDFVQHWNPLEPHQFFWVDDAFGTTQYQRQLAHDWNRVFPHMGAAVRKGARVLFTSRDYIYRAARSDLKTGAFPLISESQVVINVQELSRTEKRQILYNHIKLGAQPKDFKRRIKGLLPGVADSPRFLPEIARRLANPLFTKDLTFTTDAVQRFVEHPIDFLVEVVTNLDPQSRAALALIFMRGGALESPVDLSADEQKGLARLGVSLRDALDALGALQSSLVSLVRTGDASVWTFRHPTISDAYATIVAEDPELLDLYLTWTAVAKLLAEVTCGDVGLEGARVLIPANRFEHFLARLGEVNEARPLYTFLATRCSREFLTLYLTNHPTLMDQICTPTSYLSAVSEVDLLVRLNDLGMLPESWRTRFVTHAKVLALQTPDVDFLSVPRIRDLFTETEIQAILEAIRDQLLPNFRDIVCEWQENCTKEPESEFDLLREVLLVLRKEFAREPSTQALLDSAEESLEKALEDLMETFPDPDDRYDEWNHESRPAAGNDRSIFDDVDD